MENAVEALKMAGSVLLFVIALSVAILAFTTSRESLDKIIKYSDRESLRIDNDSRFYYLANDSDTKRYVGNETIIPAIYRAYKENFKIIFEFNDSSYFLYQKSKGTNVETINRIDLAKETIANDLDSIEFLNGIIYHKYNVNEATYKTKFKIHDLPTKSLYDYISNKLKTNYKIEEKLGTYYMEDLSEAKVDSNLKDNNNKNEKRVITYTFTN